MKWKSCRVSIRGLWISKAEIGEEQMVTEFVFAGLFTAGIILLCEAVKKLCKNILRRRKTSYDDR